MTERKAGILSKKEIQNIKETLLKRKKEIEEDLERFANQNEHSEDKLIAKFPDYGVKADENAQEITEFSTNLAKEDVLRKTLRDINNSLERIKKGTYGVCKYCKEPIPKKRILARPVASACVSCKTKLQNS